MPWWWGYTETVSPRPPRLHRISTLTTTFRCCNISFGCKGTSGLDGVARHLARIAGHATGGGSTQIIPIVVRKKTDPNGLGASQKPGNRYLRQMLLVGAMAVIRNAERHGTRRSRKVAAVALLAA